MMQKTLTPLFVRQLIITEKNKSYLESLSKILNVNKLNFLTRRKVYRHYNINFEAEYLAYRFQILKKWIEINQSYDQKFVNGLFEIISILCLENDLTIQEQNYLNEFKSVVFAKNRNIKNLIVDFKLMPKEEIWYTYEILELFRIDDNSYKPVCKKTQIYLSNQRTIVAQSGHIYLSLDYGQITSIKLKNNLLEITGTKGTYLVVADEITTLYVSFERVGKLIKKRL